MFLILYIVGESPCEHDAPIFSSIRALLKAQPTAPGAGAVHQVLDPGTVLRAVPGDLFPETRPCRPVAAARHPWVASAPAPIPRKTRIGPGCAFAARKKPSVGYRCCLAGRPPGTCTSLLHVQNQRRLKVPIRWSNLKFVVRWILSSWQSNGYFFMSV